MKLSVIVCTRNRAYAIGACLDSVAQALSAAMPVEAEIVVVDNASEDNTSTVVKKLSETCPFPVRQLFEAKKGLSAARNCALRAAQGDLLVFTDDDCRLSKDFIVDVLRYDATDKGLVLRGGRVELGDPTDLPVTILTGLVLKRWSRQMNSARHENLNGCIIGCNMLMRRAVMQRVGFFDENLGAGTSLAAGEDADYVFRAYLADILIEYVPDMLVFHYHGRKRPIDGKKLLQNYMVGTGALYVKYFFKEPDFSRPLYWDFKDSIKEIVSGKNLCLPDIGFSYKDKLIFCLLGAIRYCFVRLKNANDLGKKQ